MGLRYRKSMNLGPFRLNFSKSGVGYSYGVKGYRVTHTADGKVRTTVSVPGTGVSHVTEVSEAQYRRQQERKRRERQERSGMSPAIKWTLIGLCAFLVIIAIVGCSADEPEMEVPSMTPQEAIAMVEGTRAPTEPTPAPTPEADPEPAPKPEPTESKTEPAPEPTEPAPEPETQPKTEPATEPVTEPQTEPSTEPATQPPTEPATQPPTEPATQPPTEPATQPPTEPEPEPTEPVQQTVAYIGNKNSKKLHHTWCGSVDTMSAKNKVEFFARDAAIGLGYEPCQNCNP